MKDGIVKTTKCDKGIIITYVDENDYRKQERALRTYNMRAYKQLIFKVVKDLKQPKPNGDYEVDLYTDKTFEKVYGKITLKYYVKNNVVVIKEITPRETLLSLNSVLGKTYKGVPYTNPKDLLKIKILIGD